MRTFDNPENRRLKITIESNDGKVVVDDYYEGDLTTFANTLYRAALASGFTSDMIDKTINCEYNGWKYFDESVEDGE